MSITSKWSEPAVSYFEPQLKSDIIKYAGKINYNRNFLFGYFRNSRFDEAEKMLMDTAKISIMNSES
jgi:hypothetical protein